MEDDEYSDNVDKTDQHYVHGDDTVEEPEGEIVKFLGIADRLFVKCNSFVHRYEYSVNVDGCQTWKKVRTRGYCLRKFLRIAKIV